MITHVSRMSDSYIASYHFLWYIPLRMARRIDVEQPTSPEQNLVQYLPQAASELNLFWSRYTRGWGLTGGWSHFTSPDEVTPVDMAATWSEKVAELASSCDIMSIRDKELQNTIVSLDLLAEDLKFYLSPSWSQENMMVRDKIRVRMDIHANILLDIFKSRGYVSEPFNAE